MTFASRHRQLVLHLVAVVALSFSVATVTVAQGPTLAASQSALARCTYDTCALRLDRRIFGGRQVVVGQDGMAFPMGGLAGGLSAAVSAVPAAQDEVASGRGNLLKATVAGVIGGLLVSYAIQGTQGDPLEWNNTQVFGGLLVGGAAVTTAVVQGTYAERHFSRAVWLYNRELPR